MRLLRIFNKGSNLYAVADIKIKNLADAFDNKGEFFTNVKNIKIHIGHCKTKNTLLYDEYMKNCVIEESEITPLIQIPIMGLPDSGAEPFIIKQLTQVVETKPIMENSIKNDVATQITQKIPDKVYQEPTESTSGSGNNAVY